MEIQLTQGRVAQVDLEDYEWAAGLRWCVTAGYPARGVNNAEFRGVYYMHREIAVRAGILNDYHGDKRLTDHINLDPFDNRRSNLRAVDFSVSNINRRPFSATGLQGVQQQRSRGKLRQRWMFEAKWHGERIRGWGFLSPEAAAEARAAAIAEHWPDRAAVTV